MEVMYSFDKTQSNTVTDGSYVLFDRTDQHCHWWKLSLHLIYQSPTLSLMKVMYSFDKTQPNNVTDGSYVFL